MRVCDGDDGNMSEVSICSYWLTSLYLDHLAPRQPATLLNSLSCFFSISGLE